LLTHELKIGLHKTRFMVLLVQFLSVC